MMCGKEPVWLTLEDIERKYTGLFEESKFTREFIGQLLRANLLRGYYDTHQRKIHILEESFLDLLLHMNYNLYLQMQSVNNEPIRFSVPVYCRQHGQIRYDMQRNWYTPTEVLEENVKLRMERIFTEVFITQLVKSGLIRGKLDRHAKCTYVLMPSFIELLLYRNHTILQNLYLPDDKA